MKIFKFFIWFINKSQIRIDEYIQYVIYLQFIKYYFNGNNLIFKKINSIKWIFQHISLLQSKNTSFLKEEREKRIHFEEYFYIIEV